MPSNVKVFWWLSVAVVAYWTVMTAWHAVFPSAHELATLAKLPVELREETRRADIRFPAIATSFWVAVTLGLAWLAAFRRRNWARWAYALAFLIRAFLLDYIVAAYLYLVPGYGYRHAFLEQAWNSTVSTWSDPRSYLTPALTVVAIAAAFTGNAKAWFTARETVRPGSSPRS